MMKVSVSSIACFKSCRRQYQLKYIEGLEPVQKADALQIGETYHAKLEELYKNGGFDSQDCSKESAMALAYMKYVYPTFKMKSVEEWIEKDYELPQNSHKFVGRIDGWTEDGYLVEHKTTGSTNLDEYEFDLQWNEQVLAYMWATGTRKCYFTICRKPNIRQKKDESDEQFFERMCQWFDDETDNKIRVVEIERTDKDIDVFEAELRWLTSEMHGVHRIYQNAHYTDRLVFYRNTQNCHAWGRRCDYASVCLHYDPNMDYVEFTKKERRTKEGD